MRITTAAEHAILEQQLQHEQEAAAAKDAEARSPLLLQLKSPEKPGRSAMVRPARAAATSPARSPQRPSSAPGPCESSPDNKIRVAFGRTLPSG